MEMKEYLKPIIEDELIEIEDICNVSPGDKAPASINDDEDYDELP